MSEPLTQKELPWAAEGQSGEHDRPRRGPPPAAAVAPPEPARGGPSGGGGREEAHLLSLTPTKVAMRERSRALEAQVRP